MNKPIQKSDGCTRDDGKDWRGPASMPSTERSTLPNRMTKVAPKASTSGIAAELAIRTKLKKSKKRGLNNPIKRHRTTSARSGAKDLSRSSHLRERVSGRAGLTWSDSVCGIVLVEDLFTSQNFRRRARDQTMWR